MCELLKKTLTKIGPYDVRTVSDPLQALQAAFDFFPDIILLDLIMPGKNGNEIAKEINHEETLKSIPIIFITAQAIKGKNNVRLASEDKKQTYGYQVIAKPVNPFELAKEINRTLSSEE